MRRGPPHVWDGPRSKAATRSAGFLVRAVRLAVRAELLDLQPVGVVAAVLLGDVVAVLAHLAGQGDLGPYVGTGGHVMSFFTESLSSCSGGEARSPDLTIMSRAL